MCKCKPSGLPDRLASTSPPPLVYPLARHHFYRRGSFHPDRFKLHFLRMHARSEVVDRMSEILFAAEIAFRRLYGCVPQQELNLLQLTPAAVAQLRTGSTLMPSPGLCRVSPQ